MSQKGCCSAIVVGGTYLGGAQGRWLWIGHCERMVCRAVGVEGGCAAACRMHVR